jgi:hypothetical protein
MRDDGFSCLAIAPLSYADFVKTYNEIRWNISNELVQISDVSERFLSSLSFGCPPADTRSHAEAILDDVPRISMSQKTMRVFRMVGTLTRDSFDMINDPGDKRWGRPLSCSMSGIA